MSEITRISVDSGRAKGRLPNAIRIEREDGTLSYAEAVHVESGVFVTGREPRPYGAYIWFETSGPVATYRLAEEEAA
jgi:hypothetical protein